MVYRNVNKLYFACNMPSNPNAFETYKSTQAQYDLQMVTPASGDSADVVQKIEKLIEKHGLS